MRRPAQSGCFMMSWRGWNSNWRNDIIGALKPRASGSREGEEKCDAIALGGDENCQASPAGSCGDEGGRIAASRSAPATDAGPGRTRRLRRRAEPMRNVLIVGGGVGGLTLALCSTRAAWPAPSSKRPRGCVRLASASTRCRSPSANWRRSGCCRRWMPSRCGPTPKLTLLGIAAPAGVTSNRMVRCGRIHPLDRFEI